jgi:hypothetical protein
MTAEFANSSGEREHTHHEPEPPHVTILVNDQPVHIHRHKATGGEIKAAAIQLGVLIKEDFVLYEELPDGGTRVIHDDEEVHIRHHLRFLARPERHEVTVTVNEQPVKLCGKTATGAEIKAEAIEQRVHIQQNFVLQEELPNGMSRIVGDTDVVHLREHLRFTAIAPDDNS